MCFCFDSFSQTTLQSMKSTNIDFNARTGYLPLLWSSMYDVLAVPTDDMERLIQLIIGVTLDTILMVSYDFHMENICIYAYVNY